MSTLLNKPSKNVSWGWVGGQKKPKLCQHSFRRTPNLERILYKSIVKVTRNTHTLREEILSFLS